ERRHGRRTAWHRLFARRVECAPRALPGNAPGRGADAHPSLLRPSVGVSSLPHPRKVDPPMRALRSLFAALSVMALLAPAARATCGAEGCPFVRDAFGATRGRYSFDLRFQGVTQDELWNGTSSTSLADILADVDPREHSEVELFTKTETWTAEGHAMLMPSLRLIAALPYIHREHQHMLAHTRTYNPAFVNTWDFEGLGDMVVLAQYRAFTRAGGPSLELQGGVKLPTGRTHVPDETKDNFTYESTLEP